MDKAKQILVIDDDPDLLQLITYNLKKQGYETLTAQSGLQAIWEMTRQNRPECILLDIMMPSPNGYEICDYLKSSEDFREIPVIIVSARATGEDIETAFHLGADAYLPKPFSMDQLFTLVNRYSKQRSGEIRFQNQRA